MSLGGGDLQVILRRIRHGFIICDDTELCDKIISQDVDTEQRRRNLAKSKAIDIEKTDLLTLLRTEPDFILDELSHSPEWTATNVQDYPADEYLDHLRRVRCETLGRLDEIKTENEAKRKVQVISWQDPSRAQNADEPMHSKDDDDDDDDSSSFLFQRRTEPLAPLIRPSPLTALLQSVNNQQNPFTQYAKFDGTPNIGANQSKKFTVHFQTRKQKLLIIVASHATVGETVGFICYKYTIENREPALTQKDPSKYSLYIADDDGQAEDDLPTLAHARPIGEYEFPHLALVEQQESSASKLSNEEEYVTDDDDDISESFDDSSQSATPPPSEPRHSICSSGKPVSMIAVQDNQSEDDPIHNWNRLYESLNQKSYPFEYYVKSGSSKHVKARIDVSGEQIRIELLEKTSRVPGQDMLFTTQRLINCTLSNKEISKKRDRTRVYLTVESQQGSDGSRAFQTYEFESTVESAEQFRDQISNIIKLKNPQGRDTYEEQQQLKRDNTKKRRSIFNLIGAGIGSTSGSSTKS
ncbi:unnamed protein product [Adineta ricciae]|uniref:CRIM domain-containing protein n=1 Tax=Adineta ricciae TaxID=249248 RepID=A0A814ACJ9_ADIRI|nr:unnamed protein product [Adineta ricciae]